MAADRHIVILTNGTSGWLGGVQYSKNIVSALTRFADELGGGAVSVIAGNSYALAAFEPLRDRLHRLELADAVQARAGFGNRWSWRLKRRILGAINPQVDEALERMGATFTYPHCSRRVASADWISDFQSHAHPDKTSAEDLADRISQVEYTARHAMHIALSSREIERECHERLPTTVGRTGVLAFRSFVEPGWLDVDPAEAIARYHLPRPYALISNAMVPTKNHAVVLESLARLTPTQRRGMHIVCTGDIVDARNPGFYNRFLNRVHELGLREHVLHLGVVPKIDQVQMLRGAAFYLQPSLYEGWNTGVEEAHQFGKPLVLSDIAVHREQNPPNSRFFASGEADDLAAALVEAFSTWGAKGHDPLAEAEAMAAYGDLQRGFASTFFAMADSLSAQVGDGRS